MRNTLQFQTTYLVSSANAGLQLFRNVEREPYLIAHVIVSARKDVLIQLQSRFIDEVSVTCRTSVRSARW